MNSFSLLMARPERMDSDATLYPSAMLSAFPPATIAAALTIEPMPIIPQIILSLPTFQVDDWHTLYQKTAKRNCAPPHLRRNKPCDRYAHGIGKMI
jgi:hypothetical protein